MECATETELICVQWKGGSNSLSLFPCHAPDRTGKRHAHMHSRDSGQWTFRDYSMDGMVWNTCTRRLVNQSHGHFKSLQELATHEVTEAGQPVAMEVLVLYSKCYLSTLHECVQGLRRMAAHEEHGMREDGDIEDEEERESLLSQHASLYAMLELAWNLCQAMFLEVLPAGCLIQQLVEWVNWNCKSDMEKLEELLASPNPEKLPNYWPMVYYLVLRGELDKACSLLQKYSNIPTISSAFSSMQELLCKAPMLLPTAGLSRAELRRRWSDWRREASRRKQMGEFVALPELQLLVMILSGDDDAYLDSRILSCCDKWYELMVGKLLYSCPLVMNTDYELCYTAEWCLKEMTKFQAEQNGASTIATETSVLDRLLMAALRNDFMEVVQISSSELSNWWFVAHLANLLQHKGLLTVQRLESAPKMCEFLLVEYSCSLMSHQSLWQLALDYLSHCPTQGMHYMQLLISTMPLTSEKKASKVLHLCRHYQLTDAIVRDECKVMAMKCYNNGRIGAALSWCIRGKNSVFAAFLAEKYMESFDSLGEFVDLDLLDHLEGAMLMNKKLLFLAKYRKYQKHCENLEYLEAGQLLSSLLMSGHVPQRFLPTLLSDVHNLLKMEDLVFSVEQTYTLSHFVVQLTLDPPTSMSSHSKKTKEDLLPALQLALINNLSHAIMESSSPH